MAEYPDLAGVDAGALSFIRSYCGWHIAPEVVEAVVVRGSGGRSLLLPTLHLVSATVAPPQNAVAPAFWTWTHGELEAYSGRWPRVPLTVTMTHGYAEMPAELIGIVGSVLALGLAFGGAVRVGQVSMTSASAGDLPEHASMVLNRYRIPAAL